MKLPEYKDFSEKSPFFVYERIDNDKDLDKIESLRHDGYFYRGVHEAKYKNYSSAQRDWMTKDLNSIFSNFDSYIQKILHAANHFGDGLLFNFLHPFDSPYAILAFLQHYGAPTPFLDFTHSLDVAQFFCVHNLKHTPSDQVIDNYFSIYAIQPSNDFFNLRTVILSSQGELQRALESKMKLSKEEISNIKYQIEHPDFDTWMSLKRVFFVSDLDSIGPTQKLPFKINFNLNIVAQKGLLVYNPSDQDPLEIIFDGLTSANWVSRSEPGDTTERFFYPKIKCIDIHKSLAPIIVNRLEAKGINQDKIYPEEELVAKKIYHFMFNK
jgi:FRG domain